MGAKQVGDSVEQRAAQKQGQGSLGKGGIASREVAVLLSSRHNTTLLSLTGSLPPKLAPTPQARVGSRLLRLPQTWALGGSLSRRR